MSNVSLSKDVERMIEGMISQLIQSTERASSAVDDALRHIEASNRRINVMEQKAANRIAAQINRLN